MFGIRARIGAAIIGARPYNLPMRWPFLLLLVLSSAQAEVYRCEQGGQIVYTDQPCSGNATPETLPKLHVIPPNEVEQRLAGEYDQKRAKEKKARDKANQEWLKKHQAKKSDAERLKKARTQGKVVAGMTANQVRDLYGEPDDIKITAREDDATERWTFHLNGNIQTVDLADGRVTRHSEKKSKGK